MPGERKRSRRPLAARLYRADAFTVRPDGLDKLYSFAPQTLMLNGGLVKPMIGGGLGFYADHVLAALTTYIDHSRHSNSRQVILCTSRT